MHILHRVVVFRRDTRLPEIIQAPCPNPPTLVNGEVVRETREDLHDLVLGERYGAGCERLIAMAVYEAPTQLTLVTCAPGVDVAGTVKCQDVI